MVRGQGVGIILSPGAQKAWTLAGSQVLHFCARIMAIRLQMEDAKGRSFHWPNFIRRSVFWGDLRARTASDLKTSRNFLGSALYLCWISIQKH
jgi:hypothetical protein